MTHRAHLSGALALAAFAAIWLIWASGSGLRQMPTTVFHLTDGHTLASDTLRGRSLLINFWSVSCGVCLRDIPTLTRLQENLGQRTFGVLGVAAAHDPPSVVIDLVRRLQPNFPIALDTWGEIGAAFGDVRITPTNFLIRPDGSVAYRAQGPLDEARLRATLLTFAKEK